MARFKPPNSFPMEFPDEATSFSAEAFDQLLHYHGVLLQHFIAMPCPIGMIDPDDIRRPHEDHSNCSNGFLYECVGEVTGSFLGQSKETRDFDLGRLDSSTVQCTFPRFYDKFYETGGGVDEDLDPKPLLPCPFDRIYLKDESVTVVTWERFSTKPGILVNKLRYPAVCVIKLIDSTGKSYKQGVDFTVVGGKIQWKAESFPGYDPVTQKGIVCSIRYTYRPYYYIQRMPHEVRVAQVDDGNGNRETQRFPQMMILVREYFFENEQNNPQDSPRSVPAPSGEDISFGSR